MKFGFLQLKSSERLAEIDYKLPITTSYDINYMYSLCSLSFLVLINEVMFLTVQQTVLAYLIKNTLFLF